MSLSSQNPHEREHNTHNIKLLTGWKRALPIYVQNTSRGRNIRVFPVQAFTWIFFLAGFTYVSAGTALYLNDRYRKELEGISWLDRLTPSRWPQYSISRGDSYIRKAKSSIEAGNFSKAFHQTRVGLVRSPANLDGRTLLADMYRVAGRPDLSATILIEGLAMHYNSPDYLRKTFGFLFTQQGDQQVITLSLIHI